MRTLIAEDDQTSSKFMQAFFSSYGDCQVVFNGVDAIDAYVQAMESKQPFDMIALDIMMPKLDGLRVLQGIRQIEKQAGIPKEERVKIVMTTALNDKTTVARAFDEGCDTFLWKPVEVSKLFEIMDVLGIKL